MAYKVIHENFWRDPDVKALKRDEKHFLFYAITNGQSHFSGLYYLPKPIIQHETDFTMQEIDRFIRALSEPKIDQSIGQSIDKIDQSIGLSIGQSIDQSIGLSIPLSRVKFFLKYDEAVSVIWIRSMLKYQIAHRKINSKQLKAVENHMLSLPESRLLYEFSGYYSNLKLPFFDPNLLPYHTVSVSEAVSEEASASSPSDAAIELSVKLANLIVTNNPHHRDLSNGKREQSIARWASDIDKLIRIDKRSVPDISTMIEWCQNDDFWKSNILSGRKLREKWDTLVLQKQRTTRESKYL